MKSGRKLAIEGSSDVDMIEPRDFGSSSDWQPMQPGCEPRNVYNPTERENDLEIYQELAAG